MSADVRRIRAFERESVALVADELFALPEGWVARTPSLPLVYGLNSVTVTGPIGPAAAAALVEQHLGGLAWRQLMVEDLASGDRLQGELHAAGWKVERNVLMRFAGEPDRSLDTSAVIEAGEDDALELMAQWVGESEGPAALREVVEAARLTWRARNGRCFGVLGRDGELAGITVLFSDGSVAQVEDVFVVRGERGRGLGRMLVTHAVVQALDAGHELTFIVGDDQDWPKDLYASVGFEPVARVWAFHQAGS